ncbi:MAG TPA: response regulator transcription factor [Gaiellaceae bacterium]|jgi:DNA-binding NarL/FixJ family response regulator|nr:response regulator transcription factor [Gaiellaceae bacterium]
MATLLRQMGTLRETRGHGVDANASADDPARASRASAAIRVLVVEDHDLFREGLISLLEAEGLDVVADAGDGRDVLALVEAHAPDVVLMDLELPGYSGVDLTRELCRSDPDTRVVVLTVSADEADVLNAVQAGASGYLLKGSSIETIVSGLQAAADGASLMSRAVAARLFERLRADETLDDGNARHVGLSERELEVLKLMAVGKANIDIAQELFISPYTVRNHISSLLHKLHLRNRTEAAAYAVRHRLV